MASRSTVSTPVAVARAAAWFASGERMVPTALGSETMFMPHFTRGRPAVQPGRPASIGALRQVAVDGQIAEPRELALELQFDGAGRTMALLADDDFGLAVHQRHVELPFLVFRRPDSRFLVGKIIFL